MGDKKTFIGIFAMGGVWVTAALSLPLVNRLAEFTPEQLLAARGIVAAALALLLARGQVLRVDRYTLLTAACIPFASLGLYKGIRTWGINPTIIVITTTPMFNFIFTALQKRKISREAMIALGLMLGGVVIARHGGQFHLIGFGWSLFGTIFNAILYEFLARAESTPFQRCFWSSLGIGVVGLALSYDANWGRVMQDHGLQATLVGFAFVGGFLYWLANVVAFENLEKDLASILAQGESPCVILAAWLLLGEKLSPSQWVGVLLSLSGAWHLSRWIQTQSEKTTS